MRAILVSVDYSDYLAITLPLNRHHFEDVMIVTTPDDIDTIQVAVKYDCKTFLTRCFFDNGAVFNKWLALEHGLNSLGREGWLCVMDADVVWPQVLPPFEFKPGNLYSPLRHMADFYFPEPWTKIPIHPLISSFSGYTQIFHALDPVLTKPWYQVDWKHAGGADTFFQARWPEQNRIRPPFNVLHLGPSGVNWCGRSSPYLNGTIDPEARNRRLKLRSFKAKRTGPASTRYLHERL